MEHTPGPWTIQTIEPNWDISGDMEARIQAPLKVDGFGLPGKLYNVAVLKFVQMKRSPYSILREEGEANAKLIAAAPDLLEACERAKIAMAPIGHFDYKADRDAAIGEAYNALQDAIKKATA